MANINMHGVTPTITKEMPTNSFSVTVDWGTGDVSNLYFKDITTWFDFRTSIPQGENYMMTTDCRGDDPKTWIQINDPSKADDWAADYYQRHLDRSVPQAAE